MLCTYFVAEETQSGSCALCKRQKPAATQFSGSVKEKSTSCLLPLNSSGKCYQSVKLGNFAVVCCTNARQRNDCLVTGMFMYSCEQEGKYIILRFK